MPPQAGFKPTISAGGRLQTHALDRVSTGTGVLRIKIDANNFGITLQAM